MLQAAVQGSRHTSQEITWTKEDGTAQDLTDATITGQIQAVEEATGRAIEGTLQIQSPATGGVLTWSYGANDVAAAGTFWVQFTATFADSSKEISLADYWIVEGTLPLPRNSLGALRKKLMELVSARKGVPSFRQYTLAVMDAVADYSDRKPLQKTVAVEIVSGTASYALPADFLRFTSLEVATAPDGVIVSDIGLIPVGDGFRETYTIAGEQLTFYPTPQYTMTKRLWYAAAYVLNENEVYADMGREAERLVLLKAQAIALQLQANKAAQEAWQYQIGDERVNKEKLAEALAKRAKEMNDEYERAAEGQIGPIGMRSYYGLTG